MDGVASVAADRARPSWYLCVAGITLGLTSLPVVDALAQQHALRVRVVDEQSGQPLPARLSLRSESGEYFTFRSESAEGTAVVYDKQNWINQNSIERHTTLSAHPASVLLAPGKFTLHVEHGKAYIPATQPIDMPNGDLQQTVALKRWCDPASAGWYSGDTHIHRTVDELRNVILAEDLNVAMPLTAWVTRSDTPPASGDKNIDDARLSGLIEVDRHHVIWPRNTEYEIFSVGGRRHTLGALFVLGHEQPLQYTVPPWGQLVASVRDEPLVALDMDKLDWPFAMLLPTLAPHALYELANNHVWQTEFAFRDWNTPAPNFLAPPYGTSSGGHRAWLDYTHGMYYALLDCGLRLPPSAGTANGVHPVPAGFGRVYVHCPDGFSYNAWMRGLKGGRSFVTTGPMLAAALDGKMPGEVFSMQSSSPKELELSLEVNSIVPLLYGEVIINGRAEHLLQAQNAATQGVYRTQHKLKIRPSRSGWAAVRFWQRSDDNQVRFVHSAPWYFEVDGRPVQPRFAERQYLVERMRAEIERSEQVVGTDGLEEYRRGLEFYESLSVLDDRQEVALEARPLSKTTQDKWQEIFHAHRLTIDEAYRATGEDREVIAARRSAPAFGEGAQRGSGLRVLPYPGGRHPRRGFLDGAIAPQRETKISVFPPWDAQGDAGYAVVDVPEAIFSNLGLTYLAHRHIPTIWDRQGIALEPLEWQTHAEGLELKRRLPNGIAFASSVRPGKEEVRMEIELTNGTQQRLTGLRVQVCTMLGGLIGFNDQEPLTSVTKPPYIAVRGRGPQPRWIVTAWSPNQRVWQNPPVPCIHSDPIFPDCEPGQTVRVTGRLRFYEGDDVQSVMKDDP